MNRYTLITCISCDIPKQARRFSKDKKSESGYKTTCKKCIKAKMKTKIRITIAKKSGRPFVILDNEIVFLKSPYLSQK